MKILKLLRKLLDKIDPPDDKPFLYHIPDGFKEGRRVLVNQKSAFSRGSEGVIRFIEPRGIIWVRRDRSNSDVLFYPYELDLIDEPSELVELIKNLDKQTS